MRSEPFQEARNWFDRANADLQAVDILLGAEDCPLDIVAFHLQQAAEKLLKAILTAYSRPFPRTHDLAALVRLTPRDAGLDTGYGSSFPTSPFSHAIRVTGRTFSWDRYWAGVMQWNPYGRRHNCCWKSRCNET